MKLKEGGAGLIIIIILAIILVIGIILVAIGIGMYNKLVTMDEEVKGAWAQVENQLQRRFDLIPNYVATVKGYAEHERETFTAVTEARAKVGGATSIPEKIEANQELTSALSRLLVVVEQYPELKANQNFIRLQDELAGTENRIAVERKRYNETVKTFNQMIRRFPMNMFAGVFGFDQAVFYEADEGASTAPKVEF
ncbi:LemA family protein [bacterium]|nr:LemA family protein [bacterium]